MTATESTRSGQGWRQIGQLPVLVVGFFWLVLPCRANLRGRWRKLVATIIAAGLVLSPIPMASAHEGAWHAAEAAQEIAEHGHSHDDGEAHDQTSGHMHGHDPADHSHQFAFLSGSSGRWGLPSPDGWPPAWNGAPDPATGSGIDRPPKQMMSL